MEEAQRQVFDPTVNAFPTKIFEDLLFAGEFHCHGCKPCSSILKLVKLVDLSVIEGWAIDRQAVVNTTSNMHFIHDVECLSIELFDFVDHGQFHIDLLDNVLEMFIPGECRSNSDTKMFMLGDSFNRRVLEKQREAPHCVKLPWLFRKYEIFALSSIELNFPFGGPLCYAFKIPVENGGCLSDAATRGYQRCVISKDQWL